MEKEGATSPLLRNVFLIQPKTRTSAWLRTEGARTARALLTELKRESERERERERAPWKGPAPSSNPKRSKAKACYEM